MYHHIAKAIKRLVNSVFGVKSPSLRTMSSIDETHEYGHGGFHYTIPKLELGKISDDSNEPEEWVWVEGYKGTDKFMRCRDTQFELGKQFALPEDRVIRDCEYGFHLCLRLEDVFNYYKLANCNRFFKVRALVRKKDYDEYVESINPTKFGDAFTGFIRGLYSRDKLASKAIEFISECSREEILSTYPDTAHWSEEQKDRAFVDGYYVVRGEIALADHIEKLVSLGYSEILARYVSKDEGKFERACAVAAQPGVCMDVKIMAIFCENDD